jgi:hypothetical protein
MRDDEEVFGLKSTKFMYLNLDYEDVGNEVLEVS